MNVWRFGKNWATSERNIGIDETLESHVDVKDSFSVADFVTIHVGWIDGLLLNVKRIDSFRSNTRQIDVPNLMSQIPFLFTKAEIV